jgi:hypothetical protein
LQSFAVEVSAPMFRRLDGCLGHIYAVEGSTRITQTFWTHRVARRRILSSRSESTSFRTVSGRGMHARKLGHTPDRHGLRRPVRSVSARVGLRLRA